MANALYPLWKQSLMREFDHDKSLDQAAPNTSAYLLLVTILDGYVYSPTHQFYPSITNVVGAGAQLTTPVVNNTIFSADQVIYDHLNCAAHGIALQSGKVQRFRPDALAGESGVAVHDDGPDFV